MAKTSNLLNFSPDDFEDLETFCVKLNAALQVVKDVSGGNLTIGDNLRHVSHDITMVIGDTVRAFPFAVAWPWPETPPTGGKCVWMEANRDGGGFYSPADPIWRYENGRITILGIACNLERNHTYTFRFRFDV